MRCFFLNILLLCAALFSCKGHSDGSNNAQGIDSLCVQVYDARYRSIALTDSLLRGLDVISGGNHETAMVATNSMAYSALMKMDYVTAASLYDRVLEDAACEIEKLVADVGLMTI
ncbi:MAG: DUF5112 domain-containing protein, partial [Bacteroidaceae bacterium]|nr:DUF5112 domain-containing protein [Bacteroidaceae bacterium]